MTDVETALPPSQQQQQQHPFHQHVVAATSKATVVTTAGDGFTSTITEVEKVVLTTMQAPTPTTSASTVGTTGAHAAPRQLGMPLLVPGATPGAPPIELYTSFDHMGLPEDLLRGVYGYGWEKPSAIQQRAIVPLARGENVLAQAQSGTGKTGTFSIGGITRIDPSLPRTQVLVLSPTRELATQSAKVATELGKYLNVKAYAATGGQSPQLDAAAVRNGRAQFLVGTPGRIYDLIDRGALKPADIRLLIVDEADQMLEDKFRDQFETILRTGFNPDTCQMAFFSATMEGDVTTVATELMGAAHPPTRLLIPADAVTLDGIRQFYVQLQDESWKLDTLCDLYEKIVVSAGLIYCNRRQTAEWLATEMTRRGFALQCIHGELEASERRARMAAFRDGSARVLISTDLTARGIDVQQVSLVINLEMPTDPANYIHRIGRSGRYGRKGVAINLVTPDELRMLQEIERFYSTSIQELPGDLATLGL